MRSPEVSPEPCSAEPFCGALLLPPEKPVTIRAVWRKYIPRIAIALFFWAAAYSGWSLLLVKQRTGILEAAAIRQALVDLLLFRHKSHLYYLHMTLLVYAVLPLTRLFVEKADRRLLRYALGVWFLLGCVMPAARNSAAIHSPSPRHCAR